MEEELGMNYPEKGKISKMIDFLAKEFRRLVEGVEETQHGLEKYELTASAFDTFAALGKLALVLTENIEDLAKIMFKNAQYLQSKSKLTLLTKPMVNDQGNELKDIYKKLDQIGKQFGNLGEMRNEIREAGNELKNFEDKIKEKADSVKELVIKLQELKLTELDEAELENGNGKDMSKRYSLTKELLTEPDNLSEEVLVMGEDTTLSSVTEQEEFDCDLRKEIGQIEKELNYMLESFRDMKGDMDDLEENEKTIECGAGECNYYVIWGEIKRQGRVVEGLSNDTGRILQDLGNVKLQKEKDLGNGLVKIGKKFVKMAKKVMGLVGKVEKMGISIENRGEGLRAEGKLNEELKSLFRGQGELMDEVGIKVRGTGGMFGEIGSLLEGIGVSLDQCFLDTEFAKGYKKYLRRSGNKTRELGEKIEERKENVGMIGRMLQELGASQRDKENERGNGDIERDSDLEDLGKLEDKNNGKGETGEGTKHRNEENEEKDSGGLKMALEVLLNKLKYRKSSQEVALLEDDNLSFEKIHSGVLIK